MTPSATSRLLLQAARLVGFAGAALVVLMAWWGQEVYGYLFFSETRARGASSGPYPS
jgi:hypothetical protein